MYFARVNGFDQAAAGIGAAVSARAAGVHEALDQSAGNHRREDAFPPTKMRFRLRSSLA
jgi:hypothetical protein